MIFSVTERGTFKRCPRQALLSSKNGRHLTLLFSSLSLSVGSLVHRAHQLWLEDPTHNLSHHTMAASSEMMKAARERYKKQIGTYPSDAELDTLHEAIAFALSMAENYEVRYGKPLPDEYKLVKPEQKVRIPVPGTEHTCPTCVGMGRFPGNNEKCPDCDATGIAIHYLEGRLDGLIMHLSTGRLVVLERKTYSVRSKEHLLRANDQFLAYIWMVMQLGVGGDYVPEMLYDGLWRRQAVPRGRTFNDLFSRYVLTRSRAEIEEFGRFLPIELNKMAELYRDPARNEYKNVPWMGCQDCPFADTEGQVRLCSAISQGNTALQAQLLSTTYTTRTDDLDELPEDDAA